MSLQERGEVSAKTQDELIEEVALLDKKTNADRGLDLVTGGQGFISPWQRSAGLSAG